MKRSESDYAEMSAAVEAGEYIVGSDDRRDFRSSRSGPEIPRHRKKSKGTRCKRAADGAHDFEVFSVDESTLHINSKALLRVVVKDKCKHCGKIRYR